VVPYGSRWWWQVKGRKGRSAVIVARAARAVRGLWPDRNPLRRTLDRVEAAVAGGLAIAFLAGAPLAALTTGHAAYRIWSRTAHAEQAAWHRVPAVLLATVPLSGYDDGQVPARWRPLTGGGVPARSPHHRVPGLATRWRCGSMRPAG